MLVIGNHTAGGASTFFEVETRVIARKKRLFVVVYQWGVASERSRSRLNIRRQGSFRRQQPTQPSLAAGGGEEMPASLFASNVGLAYNLSDGLLQLWFSAPVRPPT